MKILHVAASMSPEWGGPSKAIAELTAALARRGIEVCVLAPVKSASVQAILRPAGVEMITFKQDVLSGLWTSHSSDLARNVQSHVHDYDLVHIHELWHHPHYAAAHAAAEAGKPYVVTPHGALDTWCLNHKKWKKRVYSFLIQKRVLNAAAAVHALTEDEAGQIRAYGFKGRIEVIPNGIDPGLYRELPPPEAFEAKYPELRGKTALLFLGRIHPKKGLDILAHAFGRIAGARDDVRLVIAGPDEGGYASHVRQLLTSHGAADKAVFTGMLNGQRKLAALSRADVFVLPSYSEGFSMAVLEAMVCGLPVVITHQCRFPRVGEAGAGFLVNPDPDELADALLKLVEDRELRQRMGYNGRQLVLSEFTWDSVADRMIELYRSVSEQREKYT